MTKISTMTHWLLKRSRPHTAADKAVIFAGLPDSFESEGYDRSHMQASGLPAPAHRPDPSGTAEHRDRPPQRFPRGAAMAQ